MSESEPDWTLARMSPWRFFALSEDSTRGELRRKYAALIRTYRPESHPEQFMIIRAAYEQLDAILKLKSEDDSERRAVWESIVPNSAAPDVVIIESRPDQASTPQEPPSTPACSTEELRAKLLADAASTGTDDFYELFWGPLTEYVTRVEFEEVSSLFRELERLIDTSTCHDAPWNLSEFYLSILPYLSFRCPVEWLSERLTFLEFNADLLPPDGRLDRLLFLAEFLFLEDQYRHEDIGPVAAALKKELMEKIRSVFGRPHEFNVDALIKGHREFSAPDGVYEQICRSSLKRQVGSALRMWRELLEVAVHQTIRRPQFTGRNSEDVCHRVVNAIKVKLQSNQEFQRFQWNVVKHERVSSAGMGVICALVGAIAAVVCVIPISLVIFITTPLVVFLFGESAEDISRAILIAAAMITGFAVCFYLMWQSVTREVSNDEYYWMRNYLSRDSMILPKLFAIVESELHQLAREHNLMFFELEHIFIDRPDLAGQEWKMPAEIVVQFGRSLHRDPVVRCRLLGNELGLKKKIARS